MSCNNNDLKPKLKKKTYCIRLKKRSGKKKRFLLLITAFPNSFLLEGVREVLPQFSIVGEDGSEDFLKKKRNQPINANETTGAALNGTETAF